MTSGLAGKRVVITRAPHQAESMVRLLEKHGAHPLRYPCIDIAPPQDTTRLNDLLQAASQFDWLVLTSTNTVHMLHQRMQALGLSPQWRRMAAVGPKTARLAESVFGAVVECVPDEHTGAALAQTLPLAEGMRVALPQSALADDELAQALTKRGADVTVVDAYRNVIGGGGDKLAGQIDALTFTSGSTVQNFVTRWTRDGHQLDRAFAVVVACIGPVTAATARECGFTHIVVPDTYTVPAMVDALGEYWAS